MELFKKSDSKTTDEDDFVFRPETKSSFIPNSSRESELNAILNERASTNSTDKKTVTINEQLRNQVELFYAKNKEKSIKNAVILDDYKVENIQYDNACDTLTKKLRSKLDRQKVDPPNFKHDFLNNENSRLAALLDVRHLKNRKIKLSDDTDDEEDLEDSDDENKIKLNETLAKRLNLHCERIKLKRDLIKSMYNRAMANQENSKKFTALNSLEKSLLRLTTSASNNSDTTTSKSKSTRPKTSVSSNFRSDYQQQSQVLSNNNFELININQFENKLTRPKTSPNKGQITEKTDFDVSRNYSAQNYQFRISTNVYNSNVEIFRPILKNPSKSSLKSVTRPKTTMSLLNNSSALLTSSILNSSSSNLNKVKTKPKELLNLNLTNLTIKNVSVNMQELIRKSKILESKCLSTFWSNYSI